MDECFFVVVFVLGGPFPLCLFYVRNSLKDITDLPLAYVFLVLMWIKLTLYLGLHCFYKLVAQSCEFSHPHEREIYILSLAFCSMILT